MRGTRTQSLASPTFPKGLTWDGSWHSHTPAQTLLSEAQETTEKPGGQLPIRITSKLENLMLRLRYSYAPRPGGEDPGPETAPDKACDHTLSDTRCVLHDRPLWHFCTCEHSGAEVWSMTSPRGQHLGHSLLLERSLRPSLRPKCL